MFPIHLPEKHAQHVWPMQLPNIVGNGIPDLRLRWFLFKWKHKEWTRHPLAAQLRSRHLVVDTKKNVPSGFGHHL
jgi:hypothetical protein